MPYIRQIVAEKANIINQNKKIYGTFAEIGAGQEVVNYFFKAGKASQTVAKSMSAYDMVFSNLIYGRAERYVCEKRLVQMLNHEYRLLKSRLKKTRGRHTCFFTFADTVAVSTLKKNRKTVQHGWMGLRFQSKPSQKEDEILLHVHLLDSTRLQQYEALGVLGVNLIYTAFYGKKQPRPLIQSLVNNFEKNRVSIDVLKCKGPSFKHIKLKDLSLELLRQELSDLSVFTPKAEAPIDVFYEKTLHLYSSSLKKTAFKKGGFKIYRKEFSKKKELKNSGIIHSSMYWHNVQKSLRTYTTKPLNFYLSLKDFEQFISEKTYSKMGKNTLQIMGGFFDKKTKMIVCGSEENFQKLLKKNNLVHIFCEKGFIHSMD